jgi:tetratricopeptide (TPR) repeat protein
MAAEAPLAILVCGDTSLEKVPGYWVIDCAAAVQNLLLATRAPGLGAVWTGVYPHPERCVGTAGDKETGETEGRMQQCVRNSVVMPFVLLILVIGIAPAQETQHQLSAEQKRARYLELQQAIQRDFAQKQYDQAEKRCLELIDLVPKDPSGQYNLACAQARQGKTDQSLAALEKAVTLGFGDSQHIRDDPDLEGLRKNPRFEAILRRAQTLEAEQAKGSYEKPSDMEGVKTVERQPEGGLRYHLRMSPEASKAKPARLVVWLHPSGGSGNRLAESLTMRLTPWRRG